MSQALEHNWEGSHFAEPVAVDEPVSLRMDAQGSRTAFVFAAVLVLVFVLLIIKLYSLQILPQPERIDLLARQTSRANFLHARSIAEQGGRAAISDRQGRVLASSWYAHDLIFDPRVLVPRFGKRASFNARRAGWAKARAKARRTARIFLLSLRDVESPSIPAELPELMVKALGNKDKKPRAWMRIAKNLSPEQRRRIEGHLRSASKIADETGFRFPFRGVSFAHRIERVYPEGAACAQVVGTVGEHKKDRAGRVAGRTGIELILNGVMESVPGVMGAERDRRGRELLTSYNQLKQIERGEDVQLCLDARIQRVCMQALETSAQARECEGACAVVLDAQSGEILAAASYPSVDPADLASGKGNPAHLYAAPFKDTYEPGSIIKPLLVAYGLETNRLSLDELWDCGGLDGVHYFRRRLVREYSVNPEPLTTEGVLIRSSNVGAVRIGYERLGLPAMYKAFERFGLRGRIPVAFPFVSSSRYQDFNRLVAPHYTGTSWPMGYEFTLTPLAMARMYLPFACDGRMPEPRLVKSIGSRDLDTQDPATAKQVVKPFVALEVRRVLARVVEEGTGRALKGLPWAVAGKTGTPKITGTKLYNPVVCAIAPVSAPEIVVTVIHKRVPYRGPRTYTGGSVSGPVAREIIEKTLEILGTPHDR